MKLKANGIQINYTVEGQGPWVVMSHSLACNLSMWDEQAAALARRYKVLRYDLRGHGGSEATEGDYSISLLVNDLIALWDEVGVKKTHLVGLGLGGGIVQAAAIEHPERVLKLMPCCCRAQMVPDFAVMWHGLIETVKKNGFESIVEPTVQRWFSEEFKAANPQVLDELTKKPATA